MEPILRDHLLRLAATYGDRRSLKLSTVGKMAVSDGRFFLTLEAGKNFTVRRYDQLLAWFSANWPEGCAWPEDVVRPEPAVLQEAAE